MRLQCSGLFEVALPASTAIDLFTPVGERSWVPGWAPVYPAGAASESAGTVFTTVVHAVTTIWTIIEIDRTAGAAAYSRVTPGLHAGIVGVWCVDAGLNRCAVKVAYDMTSLADDPSVLAEYAAPAFDEMMREWSIAVAASLA